MTNPFEKFYKKSPQERRDIIRQTRSLTEKDAQILTGEITLSQSIANQMIENQLTIHGIPMGIVPTIVVDGVDYSVPMATEEPSVIAAASNASKLLSEHGGVTTTHTSRLMIGEIAITNSSRTLHEVQQYLADTQETWLQWANDAHPSMHQRGGGAKQIWAEKRATPDGSTEFLVVYIAVDTKEAMGANVINTMVEALRSPIEAYTKGDVLMAILSNYATKSIVTARCNIPVASLTKGNIDGETIAKKITQASLFAQADVYRATTHNKGIMNGIDAVVLATGNDWRAIEAGAHAYASRSGIYQPLATWAMKNDRLIGTIELPLPVGTVGGSIRIHPTATLAHNILGNPDAQTLATIIASIGLAQNFAAIRALVTDGIQKGHMKLQAKSLAIAVGATEQEVEAVVTALLNQPHLNQETAKRVLEELRQQ